MAFQKKWKNSTGTKTYFAWRSARARCSNPKDASFKHYGGRGVRVCDEWLNDYDAFVRDMGEAPDGMTLDRIDVNGDYSPENCRWATNAEQASNKRSNRMITHDGETLTLSQWARKLGVGVDTLCRRLNVYEMPIERALTAGNFEPQKKQWQHGTESGYRHGCKCAECKAAHAKLYREMRQRRKERDMGSIALAAELA